MKIYTKYEAHNCSLSRMLKSLTNIQGEEFIENTYLIWTLDDTYVRTYQPYDIFYGILGPTPKAKHFIITAHCLSIRGVIFFVQRSISIPRPFLSFGFRHYRIWVRNGHEAFIIAV